MNNPPAYNPPGESLAHRILEEYNRQQAESGNPPNLSKTMHGPQLARNVYTRIRRKMQGKPPTRASIAAKSIYNKLTGKIGLKKRLAKEKIKFKPTQVGVIKNLSNEGFENFNNDLIPPEKYLIPPEEYLHPWLAAADPINRSRKNHYPAAAAGPNNRFRNMTDRSFASNGMLAQNNLHRATAAAAKPQKPWEFVKAYNNAQAASAAGPNRSRKNNSNNPESAAMVKTLPILNSLKQKHSTAYNITIDQIKRLLDYGNEKEAIRLIKRIYNAKSNTNNGEQLKKELINTFVSGIAHNVNLTRKIQTINKLNKLK